MKKLILPISILFGLMSCTESDQTITPVQTTLSLDSGYGSNPSVNFLTWVMVQSPQGEIVYTSEIFPGERLDLSELEEESFHLTLVSQKTNPTGDPIGPTNLETYTYVSPGRNYTFGLARRDLIEYPVQNATFEVKVFDMQGAKYGFMSSINARHSYSNIDNQPQGFLNLKKLVEDEETESFVSAVDERGEVRYKFFIGGDPNEVYDFSFEEMSSFDYELVLENPQGDAQFSVYALREERDYYRQSFLLSTSRIGPNRFTDGNFSFEYLNRFEKYQTTFRTLLEENGNYKWIFYEKVGDAPSSINIPYSEVVNIQNSSITNFQFTPISGATRSVSIFKLLDGEDVKAWWTVHSGENSYSLNVADEVINQFSSLRDFPMTKAAQVSSIRSDYNYDTFIKNSLVELPSFQEYEETYILVEDQK